MSEFTVPYQAEVPPRIRFHQPICSAVDGDSVSLSCTLNIGLLILKCDGRQYVCSVAELAESWALAARQEREGA